MGKKILLADDSITIQKVIELTFSDEDFDVVTVGNGRLAIERVQEVRPDVVLCDIIMPEKDGYEVCDFVKRHPQLGHVPVLLLTGAFEPFDQDRAARVGCDGFLAKPFEPQTLISKVKDLLAQGAASRAGAPATSPRPVAAAAAAAPPAPVFAPFAPPPGPRPVSRPAEPGTAPKGVESPFARPTAVPPAPQAAPPSAWPPPWPPAPAAEPPPLPVSEFEVFYPTPDEIEPLARSPEFEPVFAPSDFEPLEPAAGPGAVGAPSIGVQPEPPAPPAAPPAPARPERRVAGAPSFIPEEPFADTSTVVYDRAAEPAAPQSELFADDQGPGPASAVPGPPPWSVPSADFPREERPEATAGGAPAPPPGFEESFDEPALTLEPDEEGGRASKAQARAAWAGEALLAGGERVAEPAEVESRAAPPAGAPPADERETAEAGLFRALAEEEAASLDRGSVVALDAGPEMAASLGGLEGVAPAEPARGPAPPSLESEEGLTAPVAQTAAPGRAAAPVTPEPPVAEAPAPRAEPGADEVSFEDLATEPVAEPVQPSRAAAVPVPVEMVEQIARRVVAELGDKVIREVAWEVVPDLAEALIKREIERLKAELSQLP